MGSLLCGGVLLWDFDRKSWRVRMYTAYMKSLAEAKNNPDKVSIKPC